MYKEGGIFDVHFEFVLLGVLCDIEIISLSPPNYFSLSLLYSFVFLASFVCIKKSSRVWNSKGAPLVAQQQRNLEQSGFVQLGKDGLRVIESILRVCRSGGARTEDKRECECRRRGFTRDCLCYHSHYS